MEAIRGRGWVDSADQPSIDLDLALAKPIYARVEMSGPLGVRVGLLTANPDWMQLMISKERTLYRFPAEELRRNTLRRERFFKKIPIPLEPQFLVSALLTRVELPSQNSGTCQFEDSTNAYLFVIPMDSGARWIRVDPTSGMPLESLVFFRSRPPVAPPHELRPDIRVTYSKFLNQGLSSLPTHIEIQTTTDKPFTFEWTQAEAWKDVDHKIFDYTPPRGIRIEDL